MLVLLACGALEVVAPARRGASRRCTRWPLLAPRPSTGGLLALAWVAFKVGALSYGGGFVIIPLMQHDAVDTYRWMTDGQFLNAVALGQVTPGPVVHTVAVVGYAAAGLGGGLLAAAVAFAPSFSFILLGAERFDRLRANAGVRALPRRRRPGRDRRDRRRRDPARARARASRGSSPCSPPRCSRCSPPAAASSPCWSPRAPSARRRAGRRSAVSGRAQSVNTASWIVASCAARWARSRSLTTKMHSDT